YTAPLDGRLAIVRLDAAGRVTPVVHDEGAAITITRASRRDLDARPIISPAGHCEWLVTVFANEPFDVSQVSSALAGVEADTASCRLPPLDARLPFARTVRHYVIGR